jgi:uncharacterized DUF497 family protein
MSLEFEWDPAKAEENSRRHGVTFEEAAAAFGDPLARIFDDPEHSVDEPREIIVGYSTSNVYYWCRVPSGRQRFGSSVLDQRRGVSDNAMKKPSRKPSRGRPESELRTEYTFDYGQSRPNRFAPRMGENAVAVVLEPDVAKVFDSSDSVNRLLRSVISALPQRGRRFRGVRRKAG